MTLICLPSLLSCLSIVMKADPRLTSSSTVISTTDIVTVTIPVAEGGLGTTEVCSVFKAPGEEEL